MEKENPYQATQQLINHLNPPGWAWEIVSVSYIQEEEGETAGARDGVVLEVRESTAGERQQVTLNYGPPE